MSQGTCTQWINPLLFIVECAIRRWGPLGIPEPLGLGSEDTALAHALYLRSASCILGRKQLSSDIPSCPEVSALEPANYGPKPLKLWHKETVFSIKYCVRHSFDQISKQAKPSWKDTLLCDSISVIWWKRQDRGTMTLERNYEGYDNDCHDLGERRPFNKCCKRRMLW